MNRQDATHPTTETTTPRQRRADMGTHPSDATSKRRPECRERLTPPQRTLLALLIRAQTLPCSGNMQLVGGQIQTAKALESREMLATWEPFHPEARYTNRAQRRRKGVHVFARITPRGKDVLIAFELCNVPESEYTPGLHPAYPNHPPKR